MYDLVVSSEELFKNYQEHQRGRKGWAEITSVFSDQITDEHPKGYRGKFKLWEFNSASLVGILDFDVLESFSTTTSLSDWISLEIVLQGDSELHLAGKVLHNNGLPRIYLSSHGTGSEKKRVHKAGDHLTSIGMWVSRKLFIDNFGLDVAPIGEDIQSVLLNPDSGVVTFPLTNKVKNVCQDILSMSYDGALADQYLKAKFTELLCFIVELASTTASERVDNVSLPRGKSRILKRTMQALEQSQFLTLSLGEIADELGFCQSTLSSVFKEGYGMKLSEYLLQRKMQLAKNMLQVGDRSVLEVALEVGYDNQSSFGRAYRQYHNRTPREDFPSQG